MAHAMLVQMVHNMSSTCYMSLMLRHKVWQPRAHALFYTLRKAESLIGTGGLVSVAACSGRTFSLTLLKILRACALTFSMLSNIKCDFEVQHGEPVKKKLPSFHQESLTLKRNCLEIFLLLLGVLFLVILVFLFSFLFILWHFNLLQGSIWIHTKLLRHQLVHMSHK